MSKDYLYEKAPLVEVIAEVHWALKTLASMPESKIDPYYDLFKQPFLEDAAGLGLGHREELIPVAVPIEFVGGQPQLRLRRAEGKWPLAQVGPGVVTANIVPPYNGWAEFSGFLRSVTKILFKNYPLAEKTLKIVRLHLRYIDGFDKSFGLENYAEFVGSKLGINAPLSREFARDVIHPDSQLTFVADNQFLNRSPEGSLGRIKIGPAKMNGRDAAVLELHCESHYSDGSVTSIEFVDRWFDQAHQALRLQFTKLATEELIGVMGRKIEIG